MRHILRRVPQFWRLVGGAIGAMVIVVSIPLGLARNILADESRCLRYEDGRWNIGMIDLDTGASLNNIALNRPISYKVSLSLSPDKKRAIYLRQAPDSTFSLILKPAQIVNGRETVIEQGISQPDYQAFHWSPDSRWLAYQWQDSGGQHFLALVDVQTLEKRSQPVQTGLYDIVTLHGWSADGQYLAFSVANVSTRRIAVLSMPRLETVRTFTDQTYLRSQGGSISELDTIRWGSVGNWLAFLTTSLSSGDASLTLYSPGLGQERTAGLPYTLRNAAVLLWSPSGQYVAVATLPYPRRLYVQWRLDVFGVDGTTYQAINDKVSNQWSPNDNTVLAPLIAWTTDGKTLLYTRDQGAPGGNHADLMAFRPDTQGRIRLQENIILNPTVTPDSRYMVFKTSENGKNRLVILEINTMNRTFVEDLAPNVGLDQVNASWSPASKWMILKQGRVVTWTINTDSGFQRNLQQAQSSSIYATYPVLSTDGHFVGSIIDRAGERPVLELISLASGAVREIPLDVTAGGRGGTYPFMLSVSAQGTEIGMVDKYGATNSTIVVMKDDGSLIRAVYVDGAVHDFGFTDCR